MVTLSEGARAPFPRYWLSSFLSDGRGHPRAHRGLWLIYLAAFVTGIAAGLRGTAAYVSVPRLVKPADLDQANGQLIAGRIVGNELAGPAAGAADYQRSRRLQPAQ